MNSLFCWLLSCFGFVSASWQSFKLLKRETPSGGGGGSNAPERRALLQLWGSLACLTLWERYLEVFFSVWLPLYHVAKFLLLLLVLLHAGAAAFVFESAVLPAVRWQERAMERSLLPQLSTAASRCGRGLERWLFRAVSVVPGCDVDGGALRATASAVCGGGGGGGGGGGAAGSASKEQLGELAGDLGRRLLKVREEKKRRLRAE
jgi:hypothetical protein